MNNRQLIDELERQINNSFNCKDKLYGILPLLRNSINQNYQGTVDEFITELLNQLTTDLR